MFTYIIETNFGIYQIQETQVKTNKSVDIPSIFKPCYFEFYTLHESNGVLADLIELFEVEKHLKSQKTKGFFNGFVYDPVGDNIEYSVVYNGDNTKRDSIEGNLGKHKFRKIVFQCDGNCLLQENCEKGMEITDSDKYFEMTNYTDVHPLLKSKQHRPIYKTYEQTLKALHKLSKLNISPKISEFGSRSIDHLPDVIKELKHPFIVIEGLDGTGKSTMTKNLSKYLNAVSMATPPDSIRHFLKEFVVLPELCRRSFYSFSNYLASSEIYYVTDEATVVLDRYWHSTTAYALAKVAAYGTTEHLPSPGHEIYQWPVDLLKPSAIIYLTTVEEDRDARLNERDEMTCEEIKISENERLRQRINECYRRIGFNKWIEVDTSGTQEESLQKAVKGLKEQNVIP